MDRPYKPTTQYLLSIVSDHQKPIKDHPKIIAARRAEKEAMDAVYDYEARLEREIANNKQLIKLKKKAAQLEDARGALEHTTATDHRKLRDLIKLEGPSERVLKEIRKLVEGA